MCPSVYALVKGQGHEVQGQGHKIKLIGEFSTPYRLNADSTCMQIHFGEIVFI